MRAPDKPSAGHPFGRGHGPTCAASGSSEGAPQGELGQELQGSQRRHTDAKTCVEGCRGSRGTEL
eukprot:2184941-Alexandrium_andersonii.AAC.1